MACVAVEEQARLKTNSTDPCAFVEIVEVQPREPPTTRRETVLECHASADAAVQGECSVAAQGEDFSGLRSAS
jgi:hypothetical protein